MKKPENPMRLILIALLCANTLFFAACKGDEEPEITAPSIVSQTENQTLSTGETLTLSVVATGGELKYQWYKDAAALDGATAAEYKRENVNPTDAGSYTCKVSNTAGEVTSTPIVVTVSNLAGAPEITSFSGNQLVDEGATLTLNVVATGENLSYKWFKDGATITGTTAEYKKENVTKDDAGSYTCEVSNASGTVTPSPSIVTVKERIVDNVPNILTSKSFELVGDLVDSLEGNYKDNDSSSKGLYAKFTVRNKTNFPAKYYVELEKISMPDNHFAAICIGECINIAGQGLPIKRIFPPGAGPGTGGIELGRGETTNPNVDSYIKLFSGNIDGIVSVPGTPGQSMLRVKYISVQDESDFIQFKLYWNFNE